MSLLGVTRGILNATKDRSLTRTCKMGGETILGHLSSLSDLGAKSEFETWEIDANKVAGLPITKGYRLASGESEDAEKQSEVTYTTFGHSVFRSSSALCGTCKTILEAEFFVRTPHHSSFGRLKGSSMRCNLCLLLRQALVLGSPSLDSPYDAAWVDEDGMPMHIWASRICNSRYARDSEEVKCFHVEKLFFTLEGKGRKSHKLRTQAVLEISDFPDDITRILDDINTSEDEQSGPQTRLALSKHWLNSCQQDHTLCHQWQTPVPGPLPSRVIDVGSPGKSHSSFLHETDGEFGAYVSLSHRWGGDRVFQTTKETLQERKRSINWNSLPRTFKDAVTITRHLGIRYLWIDSLCIVQDDPDDWDIESANMGRIYQNAALNITAAAATSVDSGCFRPCEAIHGSPVYIGEEELSSGPSGESPKCTRRCYAKPRNHTKVGMQDSFRPRGPLDTRGWVLQEEVLSLRQLSFCADGVFWECIEAYASERSPHWQPVSELSKWDVPLPSGEQNDSLNLPPRAYEADGRFFTRSFKRGLLSQRILDDHNLLEDISLNRTWNALIENYTFRKLTFESDILIAIQGLATAMAAVTGGRNVAGLWEESLHHQLMWHIDVGFFWSDELNSGRWSDEGNAIVLAQQGSQGPDRRALKVPSWSWAAVRRKVSWENTGMSIPLLDILDIVIIPQIPHGLSGRLKLRGTVCAMQMIFPDKKSIIHKIASLEDPSEMSEECYIDDIEWKDKRVICLAVAEDQSLIHCLALFPTQRCQLVNPEGDILEFTRIGFVSWQKDKWYGILKRRGMLNAENEPQKMVIEII